MSRDDSGARDSAGPEKPAPERPAPSEPAPQAKPSRLERVRSFFVDHYMTVDPRTAGIFRIALGLLLFADTTRHWIEARMLYSRSGVLSNDYHLFRPTSNPEFSFFHAFSTVPEVHVCFALGVLCHLLMLVGYRSRLFAFLSFVFITSMDSRIPFVENGGYIVVNLACLWAVLLPTGQRFGFDAWRKSWRARREGSAAELNDRSDYTGERKPFVSLIGLIVIVNLALVYFWNVENKGGAIWRTGHTVHYVLYINRMVTGLAVWFRAMPEPVLQVVDWTVLACEAHLAVLIASPIARRYTRPIAMGLMLALHSTFGFMMRLGPFSWFLIGCATLLLTPIQFADIQRWYLRREQPVRVVLQRGSALALAIGRVLARLDGFELLRFEERDLEGALVGVEASDSPVVIAPGSVARTLARALPLGRYFYPVVRVVTLGAPARLIAWLTRNESRTARFFGLDAESGFAAPSICDTHPSDLEPSAAPLGPAPRERLRKVFALACLGFIAAIAAAHNLPTIAAALARFWPNGEAAMNATWLVRFVTVGDSDRPLTSISWGFFAALGGLLVLFWPRPMPRPVLWRDKLSRFGVGARELFLAYYAVCSLSQTYNENKGIPPVVKFNQPAFVQATLNYPRLFQGWGMFAPNPIQEDGVLVVDAYTIDGRRIDPYNGGAPDLDLTDDAGRGLSQLRQDYGNRIRLDHNQEYRTELKNYILSLHEVSGQPNDEIVAFDVYWLRAKCPPVGKDKLTDNDPVAIYTYRKPNYKPPEGATPIPPSPRLRSAEKWEDDKAAKPTATTAAK